MKYKIEYFNNGEFVKSRTLNNIAPHRSRWQRKKVLDKKNGFYIDRIQTKATDKDYLVKIVKGHTKKYDKFIITPDFEGYVGEIKTRKKERNEQPLKCFDFDCKKRKYKR